MSGILGVSPAAAQAASVLNSLATRKAQSTTPETPLREAEESLAETKLEAGEGDQQAIRKLAAYRASTSSQKVEARRAMNGGIDLRV